MTEPLEGAPSDNTTLQAVLAEYAEAGFRSSFGPEEGGVVRCDTCGSELRADTINMQSLRRLEGASDPADMMAVVALECGVCGAAGVLVLGYGPNASPADGDVLLALQDRRNEGKLPGHSGSRENADP